MMISNIAFDAPTIASAAAFIAAIAAFIQSVKTHKMVNSRMTEMLELVRKGAADEATLAEKMAEGLRKGEAALLAADQVDKGV